MDRAIMIRGWGRDLTLNGQLRGITSRRPKSSRNYSDSSMRMSSMRRRGSWRLHGMKLSYLSSIGRKLSLRFKNIFKDSMRGKLNLL